MHQYNFILTKYAQSMINMGDATLSGKAIADICKFLLYRIPENQRFNAINKLRDKILTLSVSEIGNKNMPPYSSIGQSLTFIKTVLNGQDPNYVTKVLNSIVAYL